MKHILVGTKNTAKIAQIRDALALEGIQVEGLPSDQEFEEVIEDGSTAQENARKKARFYAEILGKPVLSMDNALYFDGLPQEQQPGIHVRRINGREDRPTDEELTIYYQEIIRELGTQVHGHWEFAVCVAYPDGTLRETTILSPRIFVDHKSEKSVPGYPLESLQIEPESGKYIAEMNSEERSHFWQQMIGKPLCEFVKSLEEARERERIKKL